ncbi:hypothetical protein [Lysinibacillus fusiformis]|jgi:hypothetical protein|uniref:hypothetical protein n=1 Tax=Lysinibacillus fusiformis TaxID=28031 RepID=UPI003CFC0738
MRYQVSMNFGFMQVELEVNTDAEYWEDIRQEALDILKAAGCCPPVPLFTRIEDEHGIEVKNIVEEAI